MSRRFGWIIVVLAVWAFLAAPRGAAAASFPDVSPSHPYARQVEVLSQLGVVAGFADGRFAPEDPVSRQQFAKMVVLSLRLSADEGDTSPFADVRSSGPEALFPDNYVGAAYREGIIRGVRAPSSTQSGLFAPHARISLAQLMTMLSRAAGRSLVVPPPGYVSVFGHFDATHSPGAELAQYNGLLRGMRLQAGSPPRTTDPWRAATRAEAAAFLYNLMGTDPPSVSGRFLGRADDLVAYFRLQGRTAERFTVPLEELARLYEKWGVLFGIRADIAWAQMVHETGFGEYGGDVRPEQNNFAGIGATGGVPGNVFQTAELGVIAHFAHLAWYLYPDHFGHEFCRLVPGDTMITAGGDPRHFPAADGSPHRGNVRIVHDLGGKWAPSLTYGSAVFRHAEGIPVSTGW
ncbi:MAG: hypothetical protein Kow00129_08920 [Thermoleophilia bacterium]